MRAFDLILFDLGGVVVELTGVATMIEWSGGGITEEEVWHRWLHSEAVRSFESGKSSIEQFGLELVEEQGLTVTPDEFLHGFGSWIGGTYEGTLEILQALRSNMPVGCLSNTNPLHWRIMTEEYQLHETFDHHFLSYEIGLMKPDKEIFEHVLQEVGHPPQRILYFDDNQLNVDAARETGLNAWRAKGMEDVRRLLEHYELFSS